MTRPAPAALLPWIDRLRCPHCGDPLALEARTLRCPQRHSFDLARSGYAPLLRGAAATSGDDDAMARARDAFLGTGAYAPLREELRRLVPSDVQRILDIGGGTGYYLAGILDALPTAHGMVVDTSVRALRFAAHAHARAAAAAWDVFSPFPLQDGAVDLVMDVFAPRNPAEFGRVLSPGGHLLVARPVAEHMAQLRARVPGMVQVDPRKEERLHEALDPWFEAVAAREVRFDLPLTPDLARDLVAMTPSARHVDLGALTEQVSTLPAVGIAVRVSLHRRRWATRR